VIGEGRGEDAANEPSQMGPSREGAYARRHGGKTFAEAKSGPPCISCVSKALIPASTFLQLFLGWLLKGPYERCHQKHERRSTVQTSGSSHVDIFSTPLKAICLHRTWPGRPFPFGDPQWACRHIWRRSSSFTAQSHRMCTFLPLFVSNMAFILQEKKR
jgi:hypothetical protein